MVSARSAAMNRMRPAGMSMTAETGAGLSNFCIVLSFDPLFPTMEKLRCIHASSNALVALKA